MGIQWPPIPGPGSNFVKPKGLVLAKFNTTLKELPEIKVDDALGSFYGVRVNQVVKKIYASQTAGITQNYRVCTI